MEPVRKGNQRREEGMDRWRSKNKPEKKAAEDVESFNLIRGYKRMFLSLMFIITSVVCKNQELEIWRSFGGKAHKFRLQKLAK